MGLSQPLPLLLPTIPQQRWACHSCGNCCRTLVVHLTSAEREQLDRQSWRKRLGVEPYVRVGREVMLNKRADGACVFLDGENRCVIHSELGESAKPLACRIFPFSVRAVPGAWQASLRFDCPSVASSMGPPVGRHAGWLRSMAAELPHDSRKSSTLLCRGVVSTSEEIDAIVDRFSRWLDRRDVPFLQRMIGAARVTQTLYQAKLKAVRGSRFVELLKLLLDAQEANTSALPGDASRRQRGLLRQLAFAHSEHISLSERCAGRWYLFRKRFKQLKRAKRFLRGSGVAPGLAGCDVTADFDAIERTEGAKQGQERVGDLLTRYTLARLHSRAFCGPGYYGWSAVQGLGALWLAVASIGWLARYLAAARQQEFLTIDEVTDAVGMVDHAATRLPALGSAAERTRLAYLISDDGLARLLYQYRLIAEDVQC